MERLVTPSLQGEIMDPEKRPVYGFPFVNYSPLNKNEFVGHD